MFNPYPFYQPQMQMPISQNDLERGMKIAMKIASREARQKEKEERNKAKKKSEDIKQANAAKLRTLTSIEWFIIGIISYPIVGPLYNMAIHNLNSMAK